MEERKPTGVGFRAFPPASSWVTVLFVDLSRDRRFSLQNSCCGKKFELESGHRTRHLAQRALAFRPHEAALITNQRSNVFRYPNSRFTFQSAPGADQRCL